jgi:hypothetical protein
MNQLQTEIFAKIYERLNHKPTPEQCEQYREAHTRIFRDNHFYLFTFQRTHATLQSTRQSLTTHAFDSKTLPASNLSEIIIRSLEEGTFVSLEEVPIKTYAENGGGRIPFCLRQCKHEGDWPPCMRED